MIVRVIILDLPYHVKCDYSYVLPPDARQDDLVGCRVEVPFSNRIRHGVIVSVGDDADAPEGVRLSVVSRVVDDKPVLNPELLALAEWISYFYVSSLSESFSLMLPGADDEYKRRPKEMADKVLSAVTGGGSASDDDAVRFNDEQQKAFDAICNAVGSGLGGMFYLRGVTGSGKTEVLMRAARKAVESGRSVLYLVPEIALTNQLKKTALELFSQSEVAVVHSNVTRKMRSEIFKQCASGKIRMVLGTRSSVFSPLKDLGLIIVDEEQDQSYKDEKSPRFHVRQIAQKRASWNDSVLVFASATPSLECLHAVRSGKVGELVLSKRASGFGMPGIVSVLRKYSDDVISDELLESMRDEIDHGRSVVLFLNRRGYLYHYKCQTCGYEKNCPDCSVSMTYHRAQNKFICHRCKKESPYFSKCPECGSSNELYSGYGTEYVEKVVRNLFPFSNVVRMDADTTSRKGESERIVRDFENGKIDILIGTQMVSKGFNFKNLRLVGIINASQNAMSADFRQDERLFSLLVQVAGRSGRFSKDSKVLIQTDGSASEIIKFVETGRDDLFYENELAVRKAFSFPPFTRIARVIVRGEDEAVLKKNFNEISFLLHKLIGGNGGVDRSGINVIQEGQCPVYREAGKFRMHFLLRSVSAASLATVLNGLKDKIAYKSSFKVDFDMDPYDFT